ncbi:MAG: GspL/Epsl periplasmic domain-containing protein [bacterium]|nr:GspL/Epsl periplasmic domain-containing protein [bacterium]
MFERRSTGISLEADGTVRVAELTATPRSLALSRMASFEPEGPDTHTSWENGIRKAGVEGYEMSCVVIGIPDALVFRKSLTLPFRNRNRIMQVLHSELEGEIPLPPGTFVADYLDGPQEGDGVSVTVLAVENDTISRVLEMVGPDAGVRGVQTTGVGIIAASLRAGIDEGVVVWCGHTDAVVVEMRSSVPAGIRRYHLSGRDQPDAALLADAVRPLSRVGDRICLMGAGPMDTLAPMLSAEGTLRIARSLELGIVSEPAVVAGDLQDHLPAFGLALRGVGARGGLPFDLRQGQFLESRPLQDLKGPIIRTAAIAVLALLLGIGSLVLGLDSARKEYNGYVTRMESEFTELFPGTRVVNEIAQTTEKLELLKKRTETLAGLSGGSALGALSRLSALVPPDVALRLDELSYDSRKLRLEGSVSSFDAVDKIKSSLEGDPMFAQVQVQNAQVGADLNKVTFRLVMEVR